MIPRRRATPSVKPFLTLEELEQALELEKERERLLRKELEVKTAKLSDLQKNLQKNVDRLANKKNLPVRKKSYNRITVRRVVEIKGGDSGLST
jgi:hypothetical protein